MKITLPVVNTRDGTKRTALKSNQIKLLSKPEFQSYKFLFQRYESLSKRVTHSSTVFPLNTTLGNVDPQLFFAGRPLHSRSVPKPRKTDKAAMIHRLRRTSCTEQSTVRS